MAQIIGATATMHGDTPSAENMRQRWKLQIQSSIPEVVLSGFAASDLQ
jgi:hypothetical protein